jgi:hypothetical protein
MKKLIIILAILFFLFSSIATATTFYLDYVNGDDANAGDSFAAGHPWKTLTLGATAARIAPSDIIRIAKSPAPTSIGNGTWTNLSKTVTLATAGTAVIDLCETAWTKNASGDTTVTRTGVATDAKEGSYCMQLAIDASPQANIMQAYYDIYTHDTTVHNLSAYQKISFWFHNEAAIADATTWVVNLCSDAAGATPVDSFVIPAIPSTARWIPLTITKTGGGNLGAAIKSISIWSGATAPTASKYIYVDDFIACTTNGINLQSLISKNTAEQGGAEGWYAIQSINGVTVLLDNDDNTKANVGRGYSTSGTSPETVTTYIRETIKTDLVAAASTVVQQVMDSGSLAVGNIQFQGGYNTSTNEQDGETFFDGLNGRGYGIYLTTKSYITLNYLNVYRYYYGIYFYASTYNTITNLSNANNNLGYGIYFYGCDYNTITTLSNANNNNSAAQSGVGFLSSSRWNTITTLSNANNNLGYGFYDDSSYNAITTLSNASNNGVNGVDITGICNTINLISNANNNGGYGLNIGSSNNIVRSISTTGNTTAGIHCTSGPIYISNSLCAEATKIQADTLAAYLNYRVYATNYQQDTTQHWIFTDAGTINSLATDRVGGTGIMWKLSPTSVNRSSFYPLKLSIAKIAVVASKLVTVKAYMKITSTTDILGALVCPGGQLTGMTVADIKTNTGTADTDWHELTITTTPTQAGVIEVEAWAWWVANVANESVYVEDMTITQAD